MSKILNAVAVTALILSLSACAPAQDAPTASGCVPTPSGENSAKVTVTGDLGAVPTVKFDAPLKTTKTERSVVINAKGQIAEPGSLIIVDLVAYNATTGKQISATTYKPGGSTSFALDKEQLIPGLFKAIACSPIGSRVTTIVPPAEAFGEAGNSSLGVGPDDSIIFVTDVEEVAGMKAEGVSQPAEPGFPTVKLAADGTPTVTVPKEPAPTDLKIAVLKKGNGVAVKDGDIVTVQYQGVIWDTNTVFDQSWGRIPLSTPTSGVIEGFGKALIGNTVGSQVIAVIPPEFGYGPEGTTGIKGTDTLVFVIDILTTVTPAAQ